MVDVDVHNQVCPKCGVIGSIQRGSCESCGMTGIRLVDARIPPPQAVPTEMVKEQLTADDVFAMKSEKQPKKARPLPVPDPNQPKPTWKPADIPDDDDEVKAGPQEPISPAQMALNVLKSMRDNLAQNSVFLAGYYERAEIKFDPFEFKIFPKVKEIKL